MTSEFSLRRENSDSCFPEIYSGNSIFIFNWKERIHGLLT